VAFGLLDLSRPEGRRAHLGRLFERVGDEGVQPLLDIMERKLLANVGVTTSSFWVAAIPVAVGFIVFLARYPGRPLAGVRERIPALQAGLVAAYVAAVLGSVVNDSGVIVGGITLTVLAVSLLVLALDPHVADGPAEGLAAPGVSASESTSGPASEPAAPPGRPAREPATGAPA
jgi:hypothetical protein